MGTTVFKRKIYNEILEWKNNRSDKYALLIRGARRVGKSTIVEEFASKEFKSYIMLDFARTSKDINNLFEDLYSLDFFFLQLQQLTGVRLYEQESVIIFDEVQLLPKARQAIKYLVADGRYKYIETGSLLSIRKNTKDILIPSEEHKIDMYPMDFEEFLWAIGDEVTADTIRILMENKRPAGNTMHRSLMRIFRLYMLVGGMPQAVETYVADNNHANNPSVGMSLEKDAGRYKLFTSDVGLFVTLAFRDKKYTENIIYNKLLSDKLEANLGYVYENAVAQMLTAKGNKLFYYTMGSETSNHLHEIDFLISTGDKICPVEVKSENYRNHKSLDNFCRKFSSRIRDKYVVHTKDYKWENGINYIPVYMVPF